MLREKEEKKDLLPYFKMGLVSFFFSKTLYAASCISILLSPIPYRGSNQAKFGPEFELRSWGQSVAFIPEAIKHHFRKDKSKALQIENASDIKMREAFAEVMKRICKERNDCVVEKVEDPYGDDYVTTRYKITYRDGWWWKITTDPSVVEIVTKPETKERFQELRERIQNDIFNAAKTIGLEAPKFGNISNGGHINIGAENTFQNDPMLFRNFVVDFMNHSELATGILLNDRYNALPLNASEKKRERFAEVIRRFDRGEITTSYDLALEINNNVYDYHSKPDGHKEDALFMIPMITNKKRSQRLEVRSVRAQRSADDFIKLITLFQARIDYLRTVEKPIKYVNRPPITDVRESAMAFNKYLTESGLNWDDYASVIPSVYQTYAPKKDGKTPNANPIKDSKAIIQKALTVDMP